MARTPLFAALTRSLRLAHDAERLGLRTEEALARREAAEAARPSRREALVGGAAALAALSLPTRAHARPVRLWTGEVAVVGAGLGGLSAADALQSAGLRPAVYEASNRVGGRVFSLGGAFAGPVMFPGQVVERGGEFIDTGHTTMRGYANRFGLPLEVSEPDGGEHRFHLGGSLVSEAVIVDEYRDLVTAIRADLRRISHGVTASSFTPSDELFDWMDLETWLDSRGAAPRIRAALTAAYTGEYGREVDEQSALNLLLFIHGDRRSRFQPFGVWSDERFHVVGGNQQIPEALADGLVRPVESGHTLVALGRRSDGRYAMTFSTAGGTVERRADAVILAIPFSTLRNVDLQASLGLPAWKRLAINELQYGTNAKTMIGFSGRPWLDAGCSGSMYADLPDLQNVWETNASEANSGRGVLTDYQGGDRGAALGFSVAATLADLNLVVPGAAAFASLLPGGMVRSHREHWTSNPYSLGSYTCNRPGYFTTIADLEGVPVDGMYFAGEHADSFSSWQGFMEGAALSGLAASSAIIHRIKNDSL